MSVRVIAGAAVRIRSVAIALDLAGSGAREA